MKTKKLILSALALCASFACANAQSKGVAGQLSYYTPGNQQVKHSSFDATSGKLTSNTDAPFTVESRVAQNGDEETITVKVTATKAAYFRVEYTSPFEGTADGCLYYMPGFWYHKNLRSPKEAPSFQTSKSWTVREDRERQQHSGSAPRAKARQRLPDTERIGRYGTFGKINSRLHRL